MLICLVTILLDKFSFISHYRDYTAIYIQKKTSFVVNQVINYPKLVLLQKTAQNNLEKENSELKRQIEQYSILLKQQKNYKEDADKLNSLTTQIKLYHKYNTIIARAIVDINYLVNNKLLVDKGSEESISIGNAVVNQSGVIGQIGSTNTRNAQIILTTNSEFKIYLQTQSNKSKMLAQGIGNNNLIVKYINKNANLKVGDILTTTGLDDIYPANLPVVRVTKIFYENNGFNSALCEPIVNFNKLQFIAVLKNAN
ncbi:MAG: rod shape-determining protein MreC [Burkholderiales bacterium]|nr:rod shape-determining protein MreC [Burkholderiales bacterium]